MPGSITHCPRLLIGALLLLIAGCGRSEPAARFTRAVEWSGRGSWMKIDTHIHTRFSDGAHGIEEIAARAMEYGCDAIAITDHADSQLRATTAEQIQAIEIARRQFPGLVILAGVEWNVPPSEGEIHATLLAPPGAREWPLLAELKSRFDDFERGLVEHDLHTALEWLDDQADEHGVRPVLFLEHPSRSLPRSLDAADLMGSWRERSDVPVGFAGAPGHQAGRQVGAYKAAERPIDRWDPVVARVGDAWDRLLQQGHDVWGAHAPSDFHSEKPVETGDYWPGQFSETWAYVPERTGAGVLRALRAGSFFGAHGHIARGVQLSVKAEGLHRPAGVGEAIEVPAGSAVEVSLTGVVPDLDWSGEVNRLDRIEFITVAPEGARVIDAAAEPSSGVLAACRLTVPDGGLVVRARGRRIVANGPDLLFYTNPIRITAAPAAGLADWGSVRHWGTVIGWRRPAGLGLIAGTVCAGLWSLLIRRKPKRIVDYIGPDLAGPPRRGHFLVLAVFATAAAIYGSLVPLNLTPIPFEEALQRFRQIPFLEIDVERRADWVANILLFVPIGSLWLASATVDRRNAGWRCLSAVAVAMMCSVLSVGLEFTQTWFPPRTVSQNDIIAETLGGICGVVLWLLAGQTATDWVRRYTRQSRRTTQFEWLLQAYLAGLLIYSLMPLDLTIHPAEIYRKYREGRILLVPWWGNEFGAVRLWERATDVLVWVPVGALATTLWLRKGRAARSLVESSLVGLGLVAATEFAQVFVYSRFSESTDVITGMFGVVLGAYAMRASRTAPLSSAPAETGVRLRVTVIWTAITLAYAGVLCAIFWWPYEVEPDPERIAQRLDGFFRVPFAALYWGTEFNAITEVLRKTLLFGVLGALLARLVQIWDPPMGPRRLCVAMLALLSSVFGGMIELGQACLVEHIVDVTDVILYTTGAAFGLFLALRLGDAQHTLARTSRPATDSRPCR